MDSYLLSGRFRTARQKKRLRKGDYEKQLIALGRLEDRLLKERRNLPLIPLEEPYQRGWLRSFVLREDVRLSAGCDFFETLLAKINTEQHSPDRAFLGKAARKHRRSKRKVRQVRPQHLRRIPEWEWHRNIFRLTEEERCYFRRVEIWEPKHRVLFVEYEFSESWRFVLRVRPNMITHHRQVSEPLEQALAAIRNRIQTQNLRPLMNRLEGYSNKWWNGTWAADARLVSPLKNKPLHVLLGECSESQTNTPAWAP